MLRDIIAKREKELPVSTIGRLLTILEEDKSVYSLGPGEPDFDSPKNVIRFAKRMLDKGYTRYSPPGGREDLKEAVIKKLKKENDIDADLDNIIITTGSTEGILLTLMCTMDVGEGVLIPDPGFLAYKPTVEILNGIPLPVHLFEADGFQYDVDRMKDSILPEKTKLMIINTPSNPTGTVLTKKTLEEIADFAVENNLLIVSDEAYEKFVYDDAKHISIGSLNGMEDRVVSLFSFSKTYAMPGFRVGYAAGPEKLIEAMKKVHVFTSLCTPTISQMAAMEALRGPQKQVEKIVKEYDRRRQFMIKRLNEMHGIKCLMPKGAFYTFPNITSFGMDSLSFAKKLLEKAKVAVVPGSEFGRYGEGYVRLSYATSYSKIKKALERMEHTLRFL